MIQQGRLVQQHKGVGKDELLQMIRFGADAIFRKETVCFVAFCFFLSSLFIFIFQIG